MSGDVTDKVITLPAVSIQTAPCCPLCGTSASRIHSQDSRQLADIPCAGQRVRLTLHVRKFFCDETIGAHQAVQCADRFHVLKNLREVLEGLLAHHLARERKRQTQAIDNERAPAWQSKRSP